ncbi:MAG: FecR domain-containing protein [Nitrospinae bacterium]|nr:FecR domain-containing protein [Nitrospinota bacterium]
MKIAVPFWRRLAIAVWCIALNPTFVVPAAAARNFGAEIADVSGPAFVIPKGTNNILNAAKGQRLAPGDVITTGLEGEAELLYDDGNLTRLDENSRLLIEKLSVVEGGARETGIRLDLGRVKNAVSKLGNKRSHFEVHTSSAVAGVTGTPDWVVGLAGDPASPVTEVDLLGKTGEAGEIFVEGAGGAGRQAITSGMRSVVRPGMPPATPFSIDPERAEMLMRKMPLKTPKELRDLKRMELDKSSGVTQPSPEAASAPPPAASSGVPAGTEVAKSAAGAAALGAAGSAAGAAAGVAGAAGMVAGTAAGLAAGGKNEAAKVEAKAVPEKAETPKPQQPPLGSAEKAPVETAPAPRTAAVRLNLLAGGEAHSVFLKGDGTLWAWGQNNKGQLGDGTDDRRLTPVQVKGPGGKGTLQGIVAVAAGSLHTVAVKNDGTVWAWGYNDDGQLGDGSDDDRETPVQVKGPGGKGVLQGIVAVAAGLLHTVAVKNDGTVWAWGYNDDGQLGDGSDDDRETPVQVKGPGGQGPLEGMVAVAAGSSHTLALRKDGTVWAWGKNNKGQLGDDTGDDRETPVLVKGLKGIVAIAAGADHSLALKGDGTLWSWGKNESGQIGDKSVINRLAPVWVKAISGAAAIAAGENHSVALKGDGTVWSWGSNNAGQLGISEGTGTMRLVPVFVDGLSGITAIGAGSNHTFALKSDGTLWTWGSNSKGQLGDDSRDDRMVPAQVSIP